MCDIDNLTLNLSDNKNKNHEIRSDLSSTLQLVQKITVRF